YGRGGAKGVLGAPAGGGAGGGVTADEPPQIAGPYVNAGMTWRPNKSIECMIRVWARLPICMKHRIWSTPASRYFARTLMTLAGLPMAKAPDCIWSTKVLPVRSC